MTAPAIAPRWARARSTRPARVVVYGDGGVGKTTFAAAGFPGAMVLRTEDGLGTLDVPATDVCTTFAEVTGALSELADLPPGTLVIDSADWLEPIVHAETCVRHGKSSIEAFGYGKGFIAALDVWRELLAGLSALNDAGWAFVIIAHARVRRFDAPDVESFDRYELKLHEKAAALIIEWCDVVGFAHFQRLTTDRENGRGSTTRAIGTGRRVLATAAGNPAWEAKSRFPLPELMDLNPATAAAVFTAAGATLPVGPILAAPGGVREEG